MLPRYALKWKGRELERKKRSLGPIILGVRLLYVPMVMGT